MRSLVRRWLKLPEDLFFLFVHVHRCQMRIQALELSNQKLVIEIEDLRRALLDMRQ